MKHLPVVQPSGWVNVVVHGRMVKRKLPNPASQVDLVLACARNQAAERHGRWADDEADVSDEFIDWSYPGLVDT